jgi:hypothetical protein
VGQMKKGEKAWKEVLAKTEALQEQVKMERRKMGTAGMGRLKKFTLKIS